MNKKLLLSIMFYSFALTSTSLFASKLGTPEEHVPNEALLEIISSLPIRDQNTTKELIGKKWKEYLKNAEEEEVDNALHIAAKHGLLWIAEFIFNHDNFTYEGINNLLRVASKNGHKNIIERSLEHENTRDKIPFPTKYHVRRVLAVKKSESSKKRKSNYFHGFMFRGVIDDSLENASKEGHVTIVELFLEHENSEKKVTHDGIRRALRGAASKNKIDVIRLLLKHENSTDKITPNSINLALEDAKNEVIIELLKEFKEKHFKK